MAKSSLGAASKLNRRLTARNRRFWPAAVVLKASEQWVPARKGSSGRLTAG